MVSSSLRPIRRAAPPRVRLRASKRHRRCRSDERDGHRPVVVADGQHDARSSPSRRIVCLVVGGDEPSAAARSRPRRRRAARPDPGPRSPRRRLACCRAAHRPWRRQPPRATRRRFAGLGGRGAPAVGDPDASAASTSAAPSRRERMGAASSPPPPPRPPPPPHGSLPKRPPPCSVAGVAAAADVARAGALPTPSKPLLRPPLKSRERRRDPSFPPTGRRAQLHHVASTGRPAQVGAASPRCVACRPPSPRPRNCSRACASPAAAAVVLLRRRLVAVGDALAVVDVVLPVAVPRCWCG